MKKLIPAVAPMVALLVWGVSGCGEETPTGVSEGLLPIRPVTMELHLPWEAFASGLEVHGGFGTPSESGTGVLANEFRGLLHARTLGRWGDRGLFELIEDTTGAVVEDEDLRFTGGRIVVRFDTLASRPDGPVTVSAHTDLPEFDAGTASWTMAVDSAGDRRAWPEPGAAPARRVAEGVWDRAMGDSLVIELDTATVLAWTDTLEARRGFRFDVDTEDVRLEIRALQLTYDFVPSVNPDTTVSRTLFPTERTFIYAPRPGPPTSGIRVGGIPAWRSVIRMQVPSVLDGPPELCAAMGCPFELTPERINHAALVLRTRPTDPPAFQPSDTVHVDVRPVLAPERLPRSPLGPPIAGPRGRTLGPLAFQTGQQVAVPITSFVRAQVEPEPADGVPHPRAVALLSYLEPASIAFATFAGPGEPGAPFLRLILTTSSPVELP